MDEDAKAKTTIPESAAHAKLEKLDKRDKIIRSVEVTFLFIALIFNVFIAVKSVQTQQTIQDNQTANLQRLQLQNKRTQVYLSCILSVPIDQRNDDVLTKCATTAGNVKAEQ